MRRRRRAWRRSTSARDDLDFLVSGGYKWLCGPFGAAICWLRPELREQFDPPFVGWRCTVDPYTFDSRTMPLAPTARSMEYSTMGYGSAVALGGALEYVIELGVDRVLAHDQALARASPTAWSRSAQRC